MKFRVEASPGSTNGLFVSSRCVAAFTAPSRVRFFPARFSVSTIVKADAIPYTL